MDIFSDFTGAVDAIVQFDREKFSAMPTHVQAELTRLAAVGVSPVDRVVRTAEMLYANRAVLTRNKDRLLAAQLINFASQYNFHGVNDGGRAQKIEQIMRREAGEDLPEVPEADVPAPKSEFLEPEPEPATEPAE